MSFTDTANARKYASIAETAAAQAKIYANQLENAPEYAAQAAASANAAAASAMAATSAESVVNNLAISASESATDAAASAAEAGNAAAAAVSQCLRVPVGESVDILPAASERVNTFLVFDPSGNIDLLPESDVAILDSEGKIPVSMIPAIALSQIFVVSSQAEMLALDVQSGDIAKRTDLGFSFILAAEPASTLSNWVQLNDDVLAQLGMSTGASQVGAVNSIGGATTVQSAIDAKLSPETLSASTGASLVGYGASTVKAFLDGLGEKYGYSYLGELQSVADFSGLVRADGARVKLRSWYSGWSATSYGKPIGGGEFIFQSSVAKSKHDGCIYFSPTVPYTTTLSSYVTAAGEIDPTGNGVWVRDIGISSYILTDWCGINDGSTITSSAAHGDALQKVFNAAAALQKHVELGNGAIHLEKAVTLPNFATNTGAMPQLKGQGINSSYLICYPLGTDTYNLTAFSTAFLQSWSMKDFQVREKNSLKTAYMMKLGRMTGAVIERVKWVGGMQQLLAQSVLSCTWVEPCWFGGVRGAKFEAGGTVGSGYANPNANTMIRPQILSMDTTGLWVIDGCQFQIKGGSMEGCGADGGTTFRGVYVQGGVSDGTIGIVIDGMYVESNSGYPFYITHSTNRSVWHKIFNSNFNNGSATRYPVSQVVLLGGDFAYPAGVTCRLEMRGNNCQGYNYTSSSSRPDVNITGYAPGQCQFIDYDNVWIPNQQPSIDSDVYWKTSADFSFRGRVAADGSSVAERKNVLSASKTATGTYTVTANHDITSDNPMVTIYAGAGYGIINTAPAGNSVVIRTYNSTGTIADLAFYIESKRTLPDYSL